MGKVNLSPVDHHRGFSLMNLPRIDSPPACLLEYALQPSLGSLIARGGCPLLLRGFWAQLGFPDPEWPGQGLGDAGLGSYSRVPHPAYFPKKSLGWLCPPYGPFQPQSSLLLLEPLPTVRDLSVRRTLPGLPHCPPWQISAKRLGPTIAHISQARTQSSWQALLSQGPLPYSPCDNHVPVQPTRLQSVHGAIPSDSQSWFP